MNKKDILYFISYFVIGLFSFYFLHFGLGMLRIMCKEGVWAIFCTALQPIAIGLFLFICLFINNGILYYPFNGMFLGIGASCYILYRPQINSLLVKYILRK